MELLLIGSVFGNLVWMGRGIWIRNRSSSRIASAPIAPDTVTGERGVLLPAPSPAKHAWLDGQIVAWKRLSPFAVLLVLVPTLSRLIHTEYEHDVHSYIEANSLGVHGHTHTNEPSNELSYDYDPSIEAARKAAREAAREAARKDLYRRFLISAVYFIVMLAGMAGDYMFGLRKLKDFKLAEFVKPFWVSLIAFSVPWGLVQNSTFSFGSIIICYQNGFFWKNILDRSRPQQ